MIINSQDTSEWPTIAGDKEKFTAVPQSSANCNTLSQNSISVSAELSAAANTSEAATSVNTTAVMAAAATQSSGQSQAQTGASLARMTDNATSQSVIHSSSSSANLLHSDVLDQSSNNNQGPSWLDASSSVGWDKKNMHSNPGTPRLESGQFTGWGPSQFSAPFNNEGSSSSQWGASTANSMQSTWGSQSPSLNKQQSMSDWGMNSTTSTISTNQWGTPNTSIASSGDSSWGQPKRLPNTGADSWGQVSQPDSTSSTNQSNPSNLAAQQPPSSSQWNQPPQTTPSGWPSHPGASSQNATSTVPNSMPSNSTASKQWGATSVAGQPDTSPTSSTAFNPPSSSATATTPSTSTPPPTSWAGAAAKGLPKAQPKPPEPVDPIQLQIEQSINNPEGWGRVPIRQDTSWGKPPEKKKQDDSNQWQASPNNGTAIWESSKSANGQVENDKSTWNQKVAGNNDPNVWNGEGSKGKDNALWDDVSGAKEQEPIDQGNTWNAHSQPSRTISQSSGGENHSDGGWAGSSRTSPPNLAVTQPASAGINHEPPSWSSAGNGPIDASRGKAGGRWEGNSLPHRSQSVSDVGGTSYWESSMQNKPGAGWNNSKPQSSWTSDNGSAGGGNSWMQNQSIGGGNNWNDNNGGHWQGQGNRKQSLAWDDNSTGEFRDRRQFKSESDSMPRDDADMGDWNESNSVWSSANGFKQHRRPAPISENAMTSHMQQRMPSNGGPGPSMNSANPTKHQMLNMLMQMGFPKDDAHSALIQNDMNLQGAINDLKKNNSQMGPGGPMGDFNKFNPNVPPPMPLNTPYNAQANQSVQQSSHHKPNQMRNPVGQVRGSTIQQQQRVIVQQLQIGVHMGNIHPQILNLPLNDRIVRSIHQLLSLHQNYQAQHERLMMSKNSGQPVDLNNNTVLVHLKQQMNKIQQQLLGSAPNQMPKTPVGGGGDSRGLDMSSLSLNSGPPVSSQQTGSRLGIWTDKAPGGKQGASNSALHASHSTPNLQGGLASENNPWSNSSSSNIAGWSSISNPANQFLDGQNESHPTASASQSPNHRSGSGQSASSNQSQQQNSFDIPEFVPGQPWQGSSLSKIEDDPNITPGSVARSISVTASGMSSPDWSATNKGTWSSANVMSSLGGTDSWSNSKSASGTRPPPGFSKGVNRSVSMPHGPSEKTSAFSPVGSTWDKQTLVGGSTWLALRNLTPQIDGATLKTLCSQHGPLLGFHVNQGNGQALVQYAQREDAMKAHKSLNSCVLGNTTIMTEFVEDSEAHRILEQRQGGVLGRSSSVSAAPGSAMWPSGNSGGMWGNNSSGSSTWGSSLLDQHGMSSPGDFLNSNDYSM